MAVLKTITIDGVQYQLIQKADDDSLGGIKTGFTPDYNDGSYNADKNYYDIKLNDSAKAYIEIDKKDLNIINEVFSDTNVITPKDNTIFLYDNTNDSPTRLTLDLINTELSIGKTCTIIANNINKLEIGTNFEINKGDINELIKNNVYWKDKQIEYDSNSKYKIDIIRLQRSSVSNPIGEFIISQSQYLNSVTD